MLNKGWLRRLLRRLGGLPPARPTGRPARPPAAGPVPAPADPGRARDWAGPVQISWAPHDDGKADPGEVVWTWVPFEEDPGHGKDRPVVVVGRPVGGRGQDLAVVMLSSKDHAGDRRWLVLGTGAWDRQGRVSSVRLDRVLVVAPHAVRRQGAALERERFDRVGSALRQLHHW